MTKTFQLQRKINAPIISYTLLLLGWTPFSFRIASNLRGIDSTRPFLRDFGPYEQILSLNVEEQAMLKDLLSSFGGKCVN